MTAGELLRMSQPIPVFGSGGVLNTYEDAINCVIAANPRRSLQEIPQQVAMREEKQTIASAAAFIGQDRVFAQFIVVAPHNEDIPASAFSVAFHNLAKNPAPERTLYIARMSAQDGEVLKDPSLKRSDTAGIPRVAGFTTILPTIVCADVFTSAISEAQICLQKPNYSGDIAYEPQVLCLARADVFHTLWSRK